MRELPSLLARALRDLHFAAVCAAIDAMDPGRRREAAIGHAQKRLRDMPDEARVSPHTWDWRSPIEPPYWPLVRTLRVEESGFDDAAAARWCERECVAHLTRIELSANRVGDEGLARIAFSPHLVRLVSLALSENPITHRGVEALARGPRAAVLHHLRLSNTPLGTAGFEVLGRATAMRRLRALDLHGCDPGVEGLRALGRTRHFTALRALDLWGCAITDRGLAALLDGPLAARLTVLRMGENPLGDEGAARLACWAAQHPAVTVTT